MAPVGRVGAQRRSSVSAASCVAGIGAVAKRGAQQLLDDAMFFTPRGVFARVNSVALAKVEQGVKCRSNRINRDILKPYPSQRRGECGLVRRISFWCFPATGECFVADSNQPQSNGGYEWYYWKKIPCARVCPGNWCFVVWHVRRSAVSA